MPLDFPSSPVDGQTYLDYVYSSSVGAWLAANSGGTFPVSVANGGTGQTSLTSGRYLKGNGTSAVTLQAIPIPIADGGTNATTVKGAVDSLGVSIVQTLVTVKTNQYSQSSTSFLDIPDLAVTITPKYSTSKILVTTSGTVGYSASGVVALRFTRNGTAIGLNNQGNATGWVAPRSADHTAHFTYEFLDSPATTSALTYKLQLTVLGNTALLGGIWNGNPTYTSITTISVMEVIQ